jgi:hypothetical protein
MTDYHVQCSLAKKIRKDATSVEVARMVTWIPQEYAKKDTFVELRQDDGTWEDGWKVLDTYTRLESKYVIERSQDYKKTRKASDI